MTPATSTLSRSRRLALGSLVGLAALGGLTASAEANFQKTLTYSCIYPYVGEQPVKIDVDAAIPATWPAKVKTPPLVINVVATAGGNTQAALGLIGGIEAEGQSKASIKVAATGVPPLTFTLPFSYPRQAVASVGDIILTGAGSSPGLIFANPGPAVISLESIELALIFRGEDGRPISIPEDATSVPQTDGNPDTLQVACDLAPVNQIKVLGIIDVTPAPTPTPTPVVTPANEEGWFPTPTPTLAPTPSPSPLPPTPEPNPIDPTPTPSPTPSPLPPTPKPNPIDPTLTPAPPTPTPTPLDQFISYAYSLAGSATLKTLTKGSLPLSGGISAKLGLPSGNFTGDLTLAQATGNLTALGFLPVQATVNLIPTEQVKGSLKSSKLTAVAKVRIKLPSVKTFGIELAGGANCQAKQISSITLTSTQPTFLPLSGGPIAGTFSISDLSGCGFLTGLVSPLTSGGGNAIALNLTPKPVA